MSRVFADVYAGAYDLMYRDKDYDQECELIESMLRRYARTPIRTVLDLGCGTGNHALRLAAKGYEVVGVDRSSEMLGVAELKAKDRGIVVRLHQGDIRTVQLARTFDAALMMFAVLGYQPGNADVLAALRTARRHLSAGALLVFDVWYGPAVLAQRPGDRIRVVEADGRTLLRACTAELDTRRHTCTVHFQLWHVSGERGISIAKEDHVVRYFFPQELELFLQLAEFGLLRVGAFADVDRDPDEDTWNILVVARAI